MNTAGTTGDPEASAHDRALYVRADALLRLPLANRQQALARILDGQQGFAVFRRELTRDQAERVANAMQAMVNAKNEVTA